ncbi:unnamed protein product [Sphagnum jensenii]
MLATTDAAVSNAASATPLQPSTAPSTATLPPAPTTPGPNHKCCQIKQDKGSSAMEGKNAKSFLKLAAPCVR